MEYPIGTPTCWNASNINCTDPHASQCNYGCVENAGAEIAVMVDYDDGMRLMVRAHFPPHSPFHSSSSTHT